MKPRAGQNGHSLQTPDVIYYPNKRNSKCNFSTSLSDQTSIYVLISQKHASMYSLKSTLIECNMLWSRQLVLSSKHHHHQLEIVSSELIWKQTTILAVLCVGERATYIAQTRHLFGDQLWTDHSSSTYSTTRLQQCHQHSWLPLKQDFKDFTWLILTCILTLLFYIQTYFYHINKLPQICHAFLINSKILRLSHDNWHSCYQSHHYCRWW